MREDLSENTSLSRLEEITGGKKYILKAWWEIRKKVQIQLLIAEDLREYINMVIGQAKILELQQDCSSQIEFNTHLKICPFSFSGLFVKGNMLKKVSMYGKKLKYIFLHIFKVLEYTLT